MNARRVFARIALAFLLLLSQQLGMAHAISHLASDAPSGTFHKKPLPAELQCSQCLSFASIGSALVGTPPCFAVPAATIEAALAAPDPRPLPAALRAFDPRAPPLLSL